MGDSGGAIALQFLSALDRETLDLVEVKVFGNLDILEAIVLFRLLLFALNIALVLNSDFNGLYNLLRECSMWNNLEKVCQGEFGASHEFR